MNCQKTQYLIQEYLENELNSSEQIQLARHLLKCAECREEMNQMEQADEYFSSQPLFSPPETLQEKIMAQLELDRIQPENFKNRLRYFWYLLLSLGQIGLALGVLIAIHPKKLLPTTWLSFLKSIAMIGWIKLLALKNAGEHLWSAVSHLLLDKISEDIYDFLQPSWIKLALLFIVLILTFYLNGRLLFARRNVSGKV